MAAPRMRNTHTHTHTQSPTMPDRSRRRPSASFSAVSFSSVANSSWNCAFEPRYGNFFCIITIIIIIIIITILIIMTRNISKLKLLLRARVTRRARHEGCSK